MLAIGSGPLAATAVACGDGVFPQALVFEKAAVVDAGPGADVTPADVLDARAVDAPPDTFDPKKLVVEIGAGTTAFEPLADGERVPMISGGQGAQHLWTAVRVTATPSVAQATIILSSLRANGLPGGPSSSSVVALQPDPQGRFFIVGLTNLVDYDTAGVTLTVSVALTAADGRSGGAHHTVSVFQDRRTCPSQAQIGTSVSCTDVCAQSAAKACIPGCGYAGVGLQYLDGGMGTVVAACNELTSVGKSCDLVCCCE